MVLPPPMYMVPSAPMAGEVCDCIEPTEYFHFTVASFPLSVNA